MVQTLLCSAGGCHPFDVLTSTVGSKMPATQPRLTSAPGQIYQILHVTLLRFQMSCWRLTGSRTLEFKFLHHLPSGTQGAQSWAHYTDITFVVLSWRGGNNKEDENRGGHGQIEPISNPTGREVVMLATSHKFLNSRKGTTCS